MQKKMAELFITLKTKDNKEIPLLLNAENNMHNDKPVTVFVGILVNNVRSLKTNSSLQKDPLRLH
jgi:hypothetical protein